MFERPRTFRCPNCNEMINDSMTECRFCAVPIDPAVGELTAKRQEQANQAYSDSTYLRTAAIAMMVFLGLSFIPFAPLVGRAFQITFFVVLVLLIRWQVKFGSLITNDPDYKRARRHKNFALALFILATPLGFIAKPLLEVLLAQLF